MSFSVGSLVFASFCDDKKIGPCFWAASSRALIERCRPTKRGTTIWGKTMISRRGRRGPVSKPLASLSLSSFLSLRNNISPPSLCTLCRLAINDNRGLVAGRHLFGDDHFLNIRLGRHFIHDIEHDVLHDRPETPGPGFSFHGLAGNRSKRLFGKLQVHTFHIEEFTILLGQRVLRLLEYAH